MVREPSAVVAGGSGTSITGGVGAGAGLPATDSDVTDDVNGAGGADDAGGGDGGKGGVRINSDLGTNEIVLRGRSNKDTS